MINTTPINQQKRLELKEYINLNEFSFLYLCKHLLWFLKYKRSIFCTNCYCQVKLQEEQTDGFLSAKSASNPNGKKQIATTICQV